MATKWSIYVDSYGKIVSELDDQMGEWVWHEEVAALESRIADLEKRLEVDPSHHVDGISARDATIELQDAAIDELKRKVAELERDAARYRVARRVISLHDLYSAADSTEDYSREVDMLIDRLMGSEA